MAITPQINATQGVSLATIRSTTPAIKTTAGTLMVPYNVPAASIKATVSLEIVPYNKIASNINASQSNLIVVSKGNIDNPKLKSWSYTMDAHDFFILKLGTKFKTLVYDLTTQSWSWWASNAPDVLDDPNWRASLGLNWLDAGSIPYDYGSDVIVGDDSGPVLWVLDPEYGLDDGKTEGIPAQTFTRVATGQMMTQDRNFIPVYSVDLSFSAGDPATSLDKIQLRYSDDMGVTYRVADGPTTVITGNFYQELQWRSIGQVRSPGRVFQLIDDGAFARIDSMDVNAAVGQ